MSKNLVKRDRAFRHDRTARFWISMMLEQVVNMERISKLWTISNAHQDKLTEKERVFLSKIIDDQEELNERLRKLLFRLRHK